MKIKTVMGQRVIEVHYDASAEERDYLTRDARATWDAGFKTWTVRVGHETDLDSFDAFGSGKTLRAAENACRRKLWAIAKRAPKLAEEPRR